MKKVVITIILQVFAFIFCNAQLSFHKIIGTALNEYGFSVKQVSDGGFIFCGTQYKDSVNTDIILIKTNSLGDTTWIKGYGGTAADYAEQVEETTDGGLVIIGITSSWGAGMSDVYLIKTDSMGDTLWTRTYGGSDAELGHSVKQTTDGGFLLAGHTDSFGTQGDFYLVKTNANGDTLWTKAYGGIKHDHAFSLAETSDGGFIAVGHSLSFGPMGGFYAVKTNALGDTMWTRGYGGNGNSFCYSVQETSDGGYILCGETECFGAGPSEALVIKVNAAGDTVWSKTYGGNGSDFLNCVKTASGGGYVFSGYTDSFGTGGTDAMIVRTDASGNIVWAKAYGGSQDDEADAIDVCTDGGYIVTGSTKSFGSGGYDIYSVKVDSAGVANCHENNIVLSAARIAPLVFNVASHSFQTASAVGKMQTNFTQVSNLCADVCSLNGFNELIARTSHFQAYPNPVQSILNLSTDSKINDLIIIDSTGNIIYRESKETQTSRINFDDLPDGIYLLRLNGNSLKVVKAGAGQ